VIDAKWIEYQDTDFKTNYSCPHCDRGRLLVKQDLCTKKQYLRSIDKTDIIQNGERVGYDVFEYKASIGGILTCEDCGEYCSFLGEVFGEENEAYYNEYGTTIPYDSYHLIFSYVNPPIKLIKVEEKYPKVIQELLVESFSLFWNHEASCLNKLRIAVEEILNDLSVPKKARTRNGKNTGKFRNLSAHGRIEKLQEKPKYKEVADYLFALKWIGNDGSHSPIEVDLEVLKDTYKILHKALDLIYLKTDEKIMKRVREINKKKGL